MTHKAVLPHHSLSVRAIPQRPHIHTQNALTSMLPPHTQQANSQNQQTVNTISNPAYSARSQHRRHIIPCNSAAHIAAQETTSSNHWATSNLNCKPQMAHTPKGYRNIVHVRCGTAPTVQVVEDEQHGDTPKKPTLTGFSLGNQGAPRTQKEQTKKGQSTPPRGPT